MVPPRSLYFVRLKAQLLFCLPAILWVYVSWRRRVGEDVGGWKMNILLYSQTVLSGSQTEPGVLRCPLQGAFPPFRPFLYMLLSPKKTKRVSGALRCWELFLKVHSGPRSPDHSSRAKKGRGQLSQLSHSFPACCLIWNPGTCVLVHWFIKCFLQDSGIEAVHCLVQPTWITAVCECESVCM